MHPINSEIRKAPDDDLRRSILVTSRELLVREGYSSLSMRKIARSIGYSATSIYLHFKSKDQLVHALITEGVSVLMKRLRPVFDDVKLNPKELVRRICHEYVKFGMNNPGYYEIMYVLHPETLSRYPEDNYRDARSLIDRLSSVFEKGIESGVVIPSDPRVTANVLWSQMHGVVSLIIAGRFDRALDREVLIQDAVDRAVRSCFVSPEPSLDSI